VKKLVSFQEDLRQKNLIFERLNLVDKKLSACEEKLSAFGEALGEIRSDMAKLHRLCDGNKDWMEQIGGLVEHLLQCERNRGGEDGAEGEPLPAGAGL
jgi:hypothetical protein